MRQDYGASPKADTTKTSMIIGPMAFGERETSEQSKPTIRGANTTKASVITDVEVVRIQTTLKGQSVEVSQPTVVNDD
jgi:hypothetical protein